MNTLPSVATSVATLEAKQQAHDTVTGLIERNLELEEINVVLQPLLYELSVQVYGLENSEPVSLSQLVRDSIRMLQASGERK